MIAAIKSSEGRKGEGFYSNLMFRCLKQEIKDKTTMCAGLTEVLPLLV